MGHWRYSRTSREADYHASFIYYRAVDIGASPYARWRDRADADGRRPNPDHLKPRDPNLYIPSGPARLPTRRKLSCSSTVVLLSPGSVMPFRQRNCIPDFARRRILPAIYATASALNLSRVWAYALLYAWFRAKTELMLPGLLRNTPYELRRRLCERNRARACKLGRKYWS